MNKTLYDTYKNLDETARNGVRYKFKDSPVVLLFIDFLEKKAERNFKNREAVELLYKRELEKVNYARLENRFFKLRKKLLDELFPQPDDADDFMPEEELELLRCKKMIQQNNKETAYKRLLELEISCRKKNIFELLPSVIDQLIFCNQSYNRLDQNAAYFKKQEEAIQLQTDINKAILLARKIYEINFVKGIRHAAKELEELRELSVKHGAYKRFALCYHHVSLYYKMGSKDYLDSTHVISRHFRELKALMEAHPYMPIIIYRNHYSLYQQFHYGQITAFYHYNRGEFSEASEKMMEIWNAVQENPKTLSIFLTESLFTNIIAGLIAAGKYRRAIEMADQYGSFIKEAQNAERNDMGFIIKLQAWCAALGETKIGDTKFYIQKLEKYIKQTEKNNNRYISHEDAIVLRSKAYFLEKDQVKALGSLNELKDIRHTTIPLLKEFYTIVSDNNRENGFAAFKKELNKLRFNLKKPDEVIEITWLLRAVDSAAINNSYN
ncbi:MAG: hypothetical protein ACJ76F_00840 [Bacteroidia bacterium]